MESIKFSKYHGAGNDFIIIDSRAIDYGLNREIVSKMCDRHFGIGADGLMTLSLDPDGLDFRMRYWNADGGESTMCGNGGRCISLFAQHLGIGGSVKTFSASDGIHSAELIKHTHQNALIKLGMIDVEEIISYSDKKYFTNTGSPHYVEYVANIDEIDVEKTGRDICKSPLFAAYGEVNVNFVQVAADGKLIIRTYEQGVECETLACGTGATAAAIVTANALQPKTSEIMVETKGGTLWIAFEKNGTKFEKITLTGSAEKVFEGVY